MEKIIEIDLFEEKDLLEKYNRKKVSKKLIDYIIESASYFEKKDSIKIIINNHIIGNELCIDLITEGLTNEYNKSLKNHFHTNIIQIIYLIMGFIILFLSTLIDAEVFREVVLIGGWVLIWAMIELEIFSDMEGRKRRRLLKKLINSEMVQNNKH